MLLESFPEGHCLGLRLEAAHLFPFSAFRFSGLTLRSLMHSEYRVRDTDIVPFLLFQVDIHLSQHHWMKRLLLCPDV